jgi:deazaflavin-dependent oxidoreductase (nitroreductase family)
MLPYVSVQVPRGGTRGGSFPAPAALMRIINPIIFRIFRNRGFNGGRLLMLTTVGARSGESRSATLGYFPDGDNAWIIIASAGGAAKHPAWMYNLARNPDKVWVQIGNRKVKVTPETLTGEDRARAWQRVIAQAPSYAAYESKTDREIPIVRLSPAAG